MRRKPSGLPVAFGDTVLNTALAFIALFVLAVLLIAPKKVEAEGKVTPKAEFLIVLDWPSGSLSDIDLHVKGPDGKVVFFGNRETALMFLDRDQLGAVNNTVVMPDGEQKSVNDRREIITIRTVMPGEIIVNAHYYSQRSGDVAPVPVKLTVTKLNPFKIITVAEAVLEEKGQEITLANFVLDEAGRVTSVYVVPTQMVGR